MKRILLMLIVLAMVAVSSEAAYSQQCPFFKGKAAGKGGVINTTCPVMGGEVTKDTPHKLEYKGKTIGFCCAGCISAFNAAPEKYLTKLDLGSCGKSES